MRRLLASVLFSALLVPQAFAAGRELAPRPLIPKSDFFGNLEVASASGRFLTVGTGSGGRVRAIYGALSDANGHRISPAAFLIAETTEQGATAIDVAGTDDSFAVFWTDAAHAVHLTDVGLDGQILGTRTLALPSTEQLSVAWDGERFLAVVIRENQYLNRAVGTLLARDGTVLREGITLDRNATSSHVAVIDDGFIVFTSGRDFFAHVVRDDGSVTQLIAGDPAVRIVSSPIGDGRLLVVYSTADRQLRAAVWKDGARLSETTITVARGIMPVGLLPGDDRHVLVYETFDGLFALQLDDDGTPASEPLVVQPGGVTRARGAAAGGDVLFLPNAVTSAQPLIASLAVHRDRTVVVQETLSIRPAPQSHVLVGAGGGSMIGVWNEATADGGLRIRSALIGRGYETREIHELAPAGALAVRSLPWNGTEYLVLYQDRGETLVAMRVGHDGSPIGEPTILGESSYPHAAATWAGDRWAVAWTSGDGEQVVHYRTLSHGGIASPEQELNVTNNLAFNVALAFDGSRVHLAWIETAGPTYIEPPPWGYAVFTTRLRRDGRITDAAPLAIPVSLPRELAMAGNHGRIVLLVDEAARTTINVLAARTRQLVSTRTLVEAPAVSDVTWDGWKFVAAASYRNGEDSFVEIWQLGDDGTAIDDSRRTETLPREDPYVSVASSPSYGAVAGLQESDAASGPRAVIYAEREMFRLPNP